MRREKLLLLGYPGQWGSQFLWKKIREDQECLFSKAFIEEEEKRLSSLPRLYLKETAHGKPTTEAVKTLPEKDGQPQSCPEQPVLSAENILLFTEGEKKGQSIPLYEEDLQAKWNAGELSLGKVENLLTSGFQRSYPWEEEEFFPAFGNFPAAAFPFPMKKFPSYRGR